MAKRKKKTKKQPMAPRDVGTPELQMKRAILVNGGDPTFAASVLGVCFARGLINEYQLKGGQQYANLIRKIFGSISPGTADLIGGRRSLGLIDEETDIRIRARYEAAKAALLDCGIKITSLVDKYCVYEVMPYSLLGSPHQNRQQIRELRIGLDAICNALGI